MNDDPVQHQAKVEVRGGSNALNIGPGHQSVKFGGMWAQAVALIAGVTGASAGIAMAPDASSTQYVFYCALVILCATISVVCLWFACDGHTKELTTFAVLTVVAVASAAFATGSHELLADHGDLSLNIRVPGSGPMGDKDAITVPLNMPSSRSHLRVKLVIEDEISVDTCHANTAISIEPIVNGRALDGETVTLTDGKTADIDLPDRSEHVKLRAVVDTSKAGENCQVNFWLESAVLHDNEWWLL